MKKYSFILLMSIIILFINGSCEHQDEYRFIIKKNSEQEIIILTADFSMISANHNNKPMCLKPMTDLEYNDLLFYHMIKPHSNKTFKRYRLDENLNDITYIGVFNLIDIDTMSCEEFERTFPLKHEWKVTLADIEAFDWTLVYEPKE